MGFFTRFLALTAGLALLETVYAKLDLSSNSTVVVYWGEYRHLGVLGWAYSELTESRTGFIPSVGGRYCPEVVGGLL